MSIPANLYLPVELEAKAASGALQALDLVAGNSWRGVETLSLFAITRASQERLTIGQHYQLDAYDPDPAFKGATPDIPLRTFFSSLDALHEKAAQYDIIVASHAIYTPRGTRIVAGVLQRAKEGAVVLVRGHGANSVFSTLSFIFWHRAFLIPSYRAYWNSLHLDYLRSVANLLPIPVDCYPDDCRPRGVDDAWPVVIPQALHLNRMDVSDLSRLCALHYGTRPASRLRALFRHTFDQKVSNRDVACVQNDDYVYVLRKSTGNTASSGGEAEEGAAPLGDG